MRTLLRDRRGGAAVETALVMPVLIYLILGGFNYGLAILFDSRMNWAVETASRCAALKKCATDAATIAFADNQAGIDDATFSVVADSCGSRVDGTYTMNIIALFSPLTISVSACYPT